MITNVKPKRVYVINDSCHDYSEAESFGTLTFLTKGKINKLATARMYREFEAQLKDSSKEDFILLSGLTIMSVIACCMFAGMHGKLNLLIFDVTRGNKKGFYRLRTINFED